MTVGIDRTSGFIFPLQNAGWRVFPSTASNERSMATGDDIPRGAFGAFGAFVGRLGRVDLGGCPPRSPTDPGLHMTRTRFLIS